MTDAEPAAMDANRHLDGALAAALAGDNVEALRLFAAVQIKAFSHEPHLMHKAGTVLRLTGNTGPALVLLRRALCLQNTEIAVLLASRGDTPAARRHYRHAIDACPDDPAAYLAAAKLEHDTGQSWAGLLLLEALYERLPQYDEGNRVRTESLRFHAAHPEIARLPSPTDDGADQMHFRHMRALTEIADYRGALAHADSLHPPPGTFLAFHKTVFAGHAKLALAAGSAEASTRARALENTSVWLNAPKLIEHLRGAIQRREALSLVRLGDGEARFLALGDPWARQYVSAYEARCMVDVIWRNWFGQALETVPAAELDSLSAMFAEAMARATILGVSTARRYDMDTFHRGYLALLERAVDAVMAARGDLLVTDAFANIHLHRQSPFYVAFLTGLDFVGVIGPHPGLAARLARYHGIPAFQEILVPGEARLPDEAQGRATGRHFPDRFRQVMDEVRVPEAGAVFLIAAGLLGKIYGERIRALGGIAIDIGSIADAWMGFGTRPGLYTPPEAWILPDAPGRVVP